MGEKKSNFEISQNYKIVIVGASSVGKSSMIDRLVDNHFLDDRQSTVGVEFKSWVCQLSDQTVKLQLWDTAGQERFKSVSKAYFRNSVGALLVFDITNDSSFDELNTWLSDLQTLCNPNAHIILIGNKIDKEKERKVGNQQAKDYAQINKLEYLETSALNGTNVIEAFNRLALGIARKVCNGQIQITVGNKSSPFKFEDSVETPKESGGCVC